MTLFDKIKNMNENQLANFLNNVAITGHVDIFYWLEMLKAENNPEDIS